MPKIHVLPDDLTQEHCVYKSFTVRKMLFLVVAIILFSIVTLTNFFIINKVASHIGPSKIEQSYDENESVQENITSKASFKYELIIQVVVSIILGAVPASVIMFVGFKKNKERDMYYEKLWKEKIAFKYKTKLFLYTKIK